MKKLLALILSIMLLITLTACTDNVVWTNEPFDEKAISQKLPADTVVAENGNYELVWASSNCSVALIDKQTGERFETTPRKEGEPTIDEYGMPIKKNPQLESALIIKYLNEATGVEEQALSATSAVSGGRVVATKTDNGVKVDYYFDDVDIMIPVEYTLREDSLAVSINAKNIKEGVKRLISVAVLPFFCSTENDSEDTYLFVPSGSGALVDVRTTSQAGTTYTSLVYGDDASMVITDRSDIKKAVRLPVYGAKKGNTGAVAIIEQGESHASINATVGSSNIKYSGVYATYLLRGYSRNTVQLIGDKKTRNIYSQSMADDVMTVAFYPLRGEKANYSGMAEVYKNYLVKEGKMEKNENDDSLSLTFVGGAMINKSFLGVPYKDLLSATTLKDVKDILTDLRKTTDRKINAKLYGFGETGVDDKEYAGNFKINKNLGSKKDLADLNKYCEENNIDLYFDFDLITLKEGSQGYNTFFDTAYNSLMKVSEGYKFAGATRGKIDETKFRYLKRELLVDGAEKMLKKTADWPLTGISLGSLSYISYSDYSTKDNVNFYTKGNMSEDVTEIFSKVGATRKVASYEANAYAALASDTVFGAPLRSSDEKIFMCDVPFYQMVFKGYVPLSSEYVNNAVNKQDLILRLAESGCSLGYILTKDYHNEFIENIGYEFYGSTYDDISDDMKALITELDSYYDAVKGKEIVSHTVLENGLRETVFSDGVKVYVNFTDESVTSPLGEVSAQGFVWGV